MDDPEPTNLFLTTLLLSNVSENYVVIPILLILLIFFSIVSGVESSLTYLSLKELEKYNKDFSAQTEFISDLKRNPKTFIFTLLTFNSLVNISVIFIASIYFSHNLNTLAFLSLIIITLLFCKILPRFYARKNAFYFLNRFLFFIKFIIFLCYPITYILNKISNRIDKDAKKDKKLDLNNLSQALEIAENNGTSDTEHKILEGIVNFGTIETRKIMTPRIDVFTINKNLSFTEVIELTYRNGYSRIPIYDKDIDDISGILYAKDLIQYQTSENFNWIQLLKKPYFIPENKKIDDLLTAFKNRKIHLAIVVDEYGGTSGIVTLEDVIEEIIGDINDEFDEDEINYSKIDENIYVFEGKTSIIDFCKVMDIDEKDFEEVEGEADTLAGLVLEIAEEFPKRLQKISYSNLIFQVESLDRKRLKQIKVTKLPLHE